MSIITPFITCSDTEQGEEYPLPSRLAQIYGPLRFPAHPGRPHVITNFVSTLDGVVTLNLPGHTGGGDISGFNEHDQILMGILRAAADVVIVGASQLRQPPGTMWTPESIYPPFAGEYRAFRQALGKPGGPLQVVLTASGEIDLDLPIFQHGSAPVLILTNEHAADQFQQRILPDWVTVKAMKEIDRLSAHQILDEVKKVHPGSLYLLEGGPHLLRYFLQESCLDELFLTLAPQVAGRDTALVERPGFVAGQLFAPDNPLWARLVGIKQASSHLFLRYAFDYPGEASPG